MIAATRVEWRMRKDLNLWVTVDPGGQTPDWKGKVGFVPTILEEVKPAPVNTIAIVCGPPILIKLTLPVLLKQGYAPTDIFTTLENRMKCGVGKCGLCNVGGSRAVRDRKTSEQPSKEEIKLSFIAAMA